VPLVGDRVFQLTDDLSLRRNTYAECVSYIVSECDELRGTTAAPMLRPAASIGAADWGRVPRSAAQALKSRVLLYAASPLFNGGGVNGAGALQGYPSNDPNRWQLALDAAQEIINSGAHSLLSTATAPATAYSSVFTVKVNPEIILAKQVANSTTLEVNNAPVGFTSGTTLNLGLTSPSQNFVDAFPMANGKAISDPTSGYDAQNPYANRDPRLAASVFFNGRAWLGRTTETFTGGRDRPGGATTQTRTGYYLRKFLGEFPTGTTYAAQSHNFPLFRYAETLLNAAEALNELGRTTEALGHLVTIRQRAGLTAGVDNRYGVPASLSQTAARALIQNERRIELGFEEHRFWDVRRWKIAENVLRGNLNGVSITRGGTSPAFTFAYAYAPVRQLVFDTKLYYMPLPYDEITKNDNLAQNPGW
jgi:hypothetical protein